MNRSMNALIALTLAGCCFGGRPGGAPPPPGSGGTGTGTGAGTALAPGFTPDPMVVSGTAGGPIQASTLSPGCSGSVGLTPNHTFNLTAPFTTLRFSVTSTQDTTLVVRTSAGQYFCNDDTNGLNPEIVNAFPAGEVQVYVGVWGGGAGMPYTLDVSQSAFAVGPQAPLVLGPTGIPQSCGMGVPNYGPITVGTSVMLGGHTPWTGVDGRGGFVTGDTNWAPEMGQYVGQRTIVTSLEGTDDAGCPVVHVAIDNGGFYWRIASMSF